MFTRPILVTVVTGLAAAFLPACASASEDDCRRAAIHIQEIEWRDNAAARVAELPEEQRAGVQKLLDAEWSKRRNELLAGHVDGFVAQSAGKASPARIECIMNAATREAYQACLKSE